MAENTGCFPEDPFLGDTTLASLGTRHAYKLCTDIYAGQILVLKKKVKVNPDFAGDTDPAGSAGTAFLTSAAPPPGRRGWSPECSQNVIPPPGTLYT